MRVCIYRRIVRRRGLGGTTKTVYLDWFHLSDVMVKMVTLVKVSPMVLLLVICCRCLHGTKSKASNQSKFHLSLPRPYSSLVQPHSVHCSDMRMTSYANEAMTSLSELLDSQ